jgi:hypothetical protein
VSLESSIQPSAALHVACRVLVFDISPVLMSSCPGGGRERVPNQSLDVSEGQSYQYLIARPKMAV